jgi:hypothetical protein
MKRFFTQLGFTLILCVALQSIKAQNTVISTVSNPQNNGPADSGNAVTMQSFDIIKTGNTIKINWHTSFEQGHNYFEVQRSTDGINYQPIALVFAYEDGSKGGAYRYYDQDSFKLNTEEVYYRLRLVDMKGNGKNLPAKKMNFKDQVISK